MSASKISVAKKAMSLIKNKLTNNMVLGIGTGSTVNYFIDELADYKNYFYGAVSSSEATSKLLIENSIRVLNLNDVNEIEFYIDGADEVSDEQFLIKGGGGAHTREKIVASAANEFICIVDKSKLVAELGDFPHYMLKEIYEQPDAIRHCISGHLVEQRWLASNTHSLVPSSA